MKKKLKTQAMTSAQSREEVVQKIGEIGLLEREILRLKASMNDRISQIKADCDKKVSELQAEIDILSSSCQTWCEANRSQLTDNNRVKYADFSTGVVKWRLNSPSVSISQKNGAEVIDRLLSDSRYKRFVREKFEINRELILQYPEMFNKGQIDGIRISSGKESFVIEPIFEKVGGV